MSNATHSKDLIKEILKGANEPTDGYSPYHDQAIMYLNKAYRDLLSGASTFFPDGAPAWAWARNPTPKALTLRPPYETGTVSLTNGSLSGTFSSAPARTQLGAYLKIAERPTFYRIAAHTAGLAAFTLESEYIEDTGATLTFMSLPFQYDLGEGILRLVEPFRCYANYGAADMMGDYEPGKIYGVDINRFRNDWPIHRRTSGVPDRFGTAFRSEEKWLVEWNRYVTEVTKVELDWIPVPESLVETESSIPVIPIEYRDVLGFVGAHWLANDKGLDDKSVYNLKFAQAKIKAMIKAEDKNVVLTGKNKGNLLARQEQLRPVRRPEGYFR